MKLKAVKRGKYKDVALTEPLRKVLSPYFKLGNELMFPVLPDDYFSQDNADRWIARRNATARTTGRLVLSHASNVNKYTAQAMLGHHSIEQTEVYLESLSTAELDEAAAVIYELSFTGK